MPDDSLSTSTATSSDAPGSIGGAAIPGIETLLDEAQQALNALDEPAAPMPPGVRPFEFGDLVGTSVANEPTTLELLRDVELDLKIELGRAQMFLEDVLRLKEGVVVTLDKLAGDPVDIYANGRLIARGEVLVLNDNFCVRVAELIAGESKDD
jgi:flagellar motor switch protein FliN